MLIECGMKMNYIDCESDKWWIDWIWELGWFKWIDKYVMWCNIYIICIYVVENVELYWIDWLNEVRNEMMYIYIYCEDVWIMIYYKNYVAMNNLKK